MSLYCDTEWAKYFLLIIFTLLLISFYYFGKYIERLKNK